MIMKRDDFKEIIELPTNFDGSGSTKGFKFEQVYHINGWYIYQVRKPNTKTMHYEIFKEHIQGELSIVDGKFVPSKDIGKVQYPCDESFGLWAWTCPTIERCMEHIIKKSSDS